MIFGGNTSKRELLSLPPLLQALEEGITIMQQEKWDDFCRSNVSKSTAGKRKRHEQPGSPPADQCPSIINMLLMKLAFKQGIYDRKKHFVLAAIVIESVLTSAWKLFNNGATCLRKSYKVEKQ